MTDLQNKQLSDKQIERLTTFLIERTDYSLLQLMGFFTAIISSPRVIDLHEWLERLDINKSFRSQKEAEEMLASISAVFGNMHAELREKKYKPIALALIQESSMPTTEVTDLFLDWIDGYLLGMDLVGQDWVKPQHMESAQMMGQIMKVAKHLYDDETHVVRAHDFEIVQTNVKAFYDYWTKHRVCLDKAACVVPVLDSK